MTKTKLQSVSMAAALVLAAAVSSCGPSWSIVPSATGLNDPRAIAPVARDDIWIVGSRPMKKVGIVTGAEHWDGNGWTLSRTPNGSTERNSENALNGADALSSTYVWAVGYSTPGASKPKLDRGRRSYSKGNYETLVERWDGTQWSVVPSPNVGNKTNALTDVDALGPSLAWAVGYYRVDAVRKTLIQRWDGTSWSIVPSPNPGALSNVLLEVAAVSGDDIWAVGYKSSRDGHRALVLHYDGARWTQVGDVPTAGTGDNVLTSVSAASGDDVWAAGYYVDGTQHKTLTLHYDGTVWSRVPSPNGGDGVTGLRDIEVSAPDDAWAVGFEYRAGLNDFVATAQHWDGSSWSVVPSAIAQGGTKSEMLAVEKAPGASGAWAAGWPANVETTGPSGSPTVTEPAWEEETPPPAGTPTQAPEKPGSAEAPTSGGASVVAPTSGGIPVRAVDKAADAGIGERTEKTYGAVVADFDNNELPDIFLGRHQDRPRLYMNDGNGHFTETNEETFGQTDRHGCDAADVNGDGLKDIFCATGADHGTTIKHNQLYIQRPDHTFVDQAAQYGVLEPFSRARFSTFFDANGDARPDLFLANESDRGDGMPSPHRLFINDGGNAYRYAPEFGLELEADGGNVTVGDLNKDDWQDLLVDPRSRKLHDDAQLGALRVYRNDQGNGFTDVAESVGLGQSVVDATFVDVNGDAWPDVIEVLPDELRVLLNENGTFSRAFSTPLRYGFSVVAGDVNGDDRQDLYVLRGDPTGANPPDQVYVNDGTGRNFTQMSSIPSTSEGGAESVWPVDYDKNGLMDFLVLNGFGGRGKSVGPVQLIAFYPTP